MNNQTQKLQEDDIPFLLARRTTELDGQIPSHLRFALNDLSLVVDSPLKAVNVIGRKLNDTDSQVDIDLSVFDAYKFGISRQHAMIICDVKNKRIQIKDLNSTNGTFINDRTLRPLDPYTIRHGDIIRFAHLELLVHFLQVEVNR